MTFIEAQHIIDTLASGVDPSTGEVLPEDSVLGNSAQIVRALYLASSALQAVGRQVGAAGQSPLSPLLTPMAPSGSSGSSMTSPPLPSSVPSSTSAPTDLTAPLAPPAPSARSNRPPMAGKPWSAAEDAQLLAAFEAGASVKDLTLSHGRSRGGISSRLVHWGRMTEQQAGVVPRKRGAAD